LCLMCVFTNLNGDKLQIVTNTAFIRFSFKGPKVIVRPNLTELLSFVQEFVQSLADHVPENKTLLLR
jgi:hypothetical protein